MREILAGNCIRKQFQWMECDWMTSCSYRRLAGSYLGQAVKSSEVRTDGSRPTGVLFWGIGSSIQCFYWGYCHC